MQRTPTTKQLPLPIADTTARIPTQIIRTRQPSHALAIVLRDGNEETYGMSNAVDVLSAVSGVESLLRLQWPLRAVDGVHVLDGSVGR